MKKGTVVISVILAVIAVLSATLFAGIFSSQETYKKTIAEIDHEKTNVTALLATSTAASTVISFLPDDTGSSVANELADLSSVFLFILAFLYLEKYSLTIIGWLLFRFIIPCVCITLVLETFIPAIHIFVKWAVNVLVFTVLLLCVVVGGVRISGMIQETYQYSAKAVIDTVDEAQAAITDEQAATVTPEITETPVTMEEVVTAEATPAPDAEAAKTNGIFGAITSTAGNIAAGAGNIVSGAGAAVSGAVSGAGTAVSEAFSGAKEAVSSAATQVNEKIEWAKTILNNIVESIAVLLVSCCVIPILTLLVVLYLGKRLLDLTPPENTVKVIQERFSGTIIHMNRSLKRKAIEANTKKNS